MSTFTKVLKIIGIIAAVAGAAAGIYFAVTKILERKKDKDSEENYVSCSCYDDESCCEEEETAKEEASAE
jgi:rRNA processing protein Gar1